MKSETEVAKSVRMPRKLLGDVLAVVLTVAVILGANYLLQRPEVQDIFRGWGYEPSKAMAKIEEEIELTDAGKRIFRATRPSVETREDFNHHCVNQKIEVALLGCYAEGNIYIYEIAQENLADANKVTAAHELLHAVWQRMGKKEQAEIHALLDEVYQKNREWFDEELATYEESARTEEMFTRAGTKLADLPEKLEKIYGRFLRNRQKIVKFYENYQAPFRELKDKNEKLREEALRVKAEIDTERERYFETMEKLDEEIEKFNDCADTAGCFETNAKFQEERNKLEKKRAELEAERARLNQKIEENNACVAEYQANQAALGELNDAMNSQVEKI